MQSCTTCGEQLRPGDPICPGCGTDNAAPVAPAPQQVNAPAPSPPPAQSPASITGPRLILKLQGQLTQQVFPLLGTVIVGRFHESTGPVDIDLGGVPGAEYISRRHARLYRDSNGTWLVEDLGASNGTFLRKTGQTNFTRLPAQTPHPLTPKDEIAFGNVQFIFDE